MEVRCRICSRTEPFESVPLNSRLESSPDTISDMFTYCTQLEVSPDDMLPQKICSDCLKNLMVAFEFRRLCHRSNAWFWQALRQDEEPQLTSASPVHEGGTYRCCFTSCDRKTSDYIELREHAKQNHASARHSNELTGCNDRRFVCTICMTGFSDRLQWNIHRAFLRGVQRLYECTRCYETFPAEVQLAAHEVVGACRPVDEEEEDDGKEMDVDEYQALQDLIRRILDAMGTGGLVRISQEEQDWVMENNAAFLKRLHRNELKHSNKRVKLFYACESCNFRTGLSGDVLTHLDIGVCSAGFYMALGFCVQDLRCVVSFECEACDYRTESNSNFKQHQKRRQHSGMRTSMTTGPVVTTEYPCEYCGQISLSSTDRKRHQRTCSYVAKRTISHELKNPLGMKEATGKPEDYEALDERANDQESTKEAQQTIGCHQYEEGKRSKQNLIRRILKAQSTNSLVRISKEEHDSVQENNSAFLEMVNRIHLKHSNKRVKLFYVCESCSFQVEMRYRMHCHMEAGTCSRGYYMAFGFCAVNYRSAPLYECEMCDLRTSNLTNFKTHQKRRNHSGMRTTMARKEVIQTDHPCEYCGKILTSFRNLQKHHISCLGKRDPCRSEQDTEQKPDLIALEEFDPLEGGSNQSAPDQELAKRPLLKCAMCGYTFNARGNLNRHLRSCSKTNSLNQSE